MNRKLIYTIVIILSIMMVGTAWTYTTPPNSIIDELGFRFGNTNLSSTGLTTDDIFAKNIGGVIYAEQYQSLQAAINSCLDSGCVIYIGSGIYISNDIIVDKDIILRGSGVNNTILKSTVNSEDLIKFHRNVTIEDMTLDLNGNAKNGLSVIIEVGTPIVISKVVLDRINIIGNHAAGGQFLAVFWDTNENPANNIHSVTIRDSFFSNYQDNVDRFATSRVKDVYIENTIFNTDRVNFYEGEKVTIVKSTFKSLGKVPVYFDFSGDLVVRDSFFNSTDPDYPAFSINRPIYSLIDNVDTSTNRIQLSPSNDGAIRGDKIIKIKNSKVRSLIIQNNMENISSLELYNNIITPKNYGASYDLGAVVSSATLNKSLKRLVLKNNDFNLTEVSGNYLIRSYNNVYIDRLDMFENNMSHIFATNLVTINNTFTRNNYGTSPFNFGNSIACTDRISAFGENDNCYNTTAHRPCWANASGVNNWVRYNDSVLGC